MAGSVLLVFGVGLPWTLGTVPGVQKQKKWTLGTVPSVHTDQVSIVKADTGGTWILETVSGVRF